MRYTSPAGEAGYPGEVSLSMRISMPSSTELVFEHHAVADQETPINLTRHDYFNLSAGRSADILDHQLWLNSEKITEQSDEGLPTGRLVDVSGTVFDFKQSRSVAQHGELHDGGLTDGFDQNYVLASEESRLKVAGRVLDPISGRGLEILTTQPCVMLYTGGYLTPATSRFNRFAGLCLETQSFPDAMNIPEFPSTIIGPDRPYGEKVVYRFFQDYI